MPEEDINEVFRKPSLVEVVFEVRFPNLFYIAQKIGDFQIGIMDDFPRSSEIIEQPFIIGGSKTTLEEEISKPTPIWQFESENGKTKLTIRSNRLNIISQEYKSYNNPAVEKKFRDLIYKIVQSFLEKVPIKKFSRVGFRYIDQCPLEEMTNEYFKNYYNPVFDINKYRIADILENHVLIRTKKGDFYLLFQCGIKQFEGKYKYFLDYDGYANDIETNKFIEVSDELKKMIKKEYYSHITEAFKNYMRGIEHEG